MRTWAVLGAELGEAGEEGGAAGVGGHRRRSRQLPPLHIHAARRTCLRRRSARAEHFVAPRDAPARLDGGRAQKRAATLLRFAESRARGRRRAFAQDRPRQCRRAAAPTPSRRRRRRTRRRQRRGWRWCAPSLTGFKGVSRQRQQSKPFQAQLHARRAPQAPGQLRDGGGGGAGRRALPRAGGRRGGARGCRDCRGARADDGGGGARGGGGGGADAGARRECDGLQGRVSHRQSGSNPSSWRA